MDEKKNVTWKKIKEMRVASPTNWLIKALDIAPGRPALVVAKAGVGKTLAIQSLELAVATGRPVWGRFECRSGLVRHLDRDQGSRTTEHRFRVLAKGMGLEMEEIENLETTSDIGLDLLSSTDEDWLEAMDGCALLVVDALRQMIPGLDENDSRIGERIQRLCVLSDLTQCSVILLHHAKKGELVDMDAARGSGSIGGACGAYYVISGESHNVRKWTRLRRHLEAVGAELFQFELCLEELDDGAVDIVADLGLDSELEAEIQLQLIGKPNISHSELLLGLRTAGIKRKKSSMLKILASLVQRGLVKEALGAKNAKLLSWAGAS